MKKTVCILSVLLMLLLFSGAASAEKNLYSVSVEGEISLYISPDDESYVVTKIPACSKLKLLETQRTWGLVEFENKAGWINLSFTRSNYSKAAEATGNDFSRSVQVKAESGRASLYNVPSEEEHLGSKVKYNIPNGTVLKITRETKSGWGLVSMNGKYAWIKMGNTEPYHSETDADQYGIYYVYVLSEDGMGLELWDSEKTKNLCAIIPDCIKLTVRETKGNYAYVSYDAINGWIDLRQTTQSLSNAQSNAGVEVSAEYIVTPKEENESVDILSVPSDKPCDGGNVVASLEKNESVFVLRSTMGGWSLVNSDGTLGWIPPENLSKAEIETEEDITDVYEKAEKGFVATVEGAGVKLYSDISCKTEIATVPEAVMVNIVAEKSGYKYVSCDYAAGWAKDIPVESTYESALEKYGSEKLEFYVTERETELMSLPTGNELCGSVVLAVVPEGQYFEVLRVAETGKAKWLLAEIDGKTGWIKMSHADKAKLSLIMILVIILIAALILAVVALAVHMIRKKSLKKSKKEVDENGKMLQSENSGAGEKASDVPCER